VGDLGQRRDVGHCPEVSRRDHHRGDRLGRRRQRAVELVGGHAVGDPEIGVEHRGDERRLEPAHDHPVDGRGVDVALHDHRPPVVAQREARRVVSLRGAVDQEPAPPGAPRGGGELLRTGERGRLGPGVDSLDQRGDVERQGGVA
jgi:hypothetical protein